MTNRTTKPARKVPRPAASNNTVGAIHFRATLLRPAGRPVSWMFLKLTKEASASLPSRGMVSVEGTLNATPFRATLEPDGNGGHWMKVGRALRERAGAEAGPAVHIVMTPTDWTLEPTVPPDLRQALAEAPPRAREAWKDITPKARRDWVQWVASAKHATTRAKRIASACDMLAKGKRRPCCFDRSGIYAGGMACPEAADEPRS